MVQLDGRMSFNVVDGMGKPADVPYKPDIMLNLLRTLVEKCPCKGLVWFAPGVHELMAGRPYYDDFHTVTVVGYLLTSTNLIEMS